MSQKCPTRTSTRSVALIGGPCSMLKSSSGFHSKLDWRVKSLRESSIVFDFCSDPCPSRGSVFSLSVLLMWWLSAAGSEG